jgi:hypothetical protein
MNFSVFVMLNLFDPAVTAFQHNTLPPHVILKQVQDDEELL